MQSSIGLNDNFDSAIRAVRLLIELTELRRSAPAHELRQHLTELLNVRNADSRLAAGPSTRQTSAQGELLAAQPTP
jgi:hypothetical protein